MGLIYCFTNNINHKKYIGQTICSNQERYYNHKSSYQNEKSCEFNSPLHCAFRKYGFENFTYSIIVDNIYDIELLNRLEIYYIQYYNTQIPNGYNIEKGGKNCSKPKTPQQREKIMWSKGKLTEAEVIELRLAYQEGKSPTQIYNEKYKDKLHYNAFLNIWSGRKYKMVMPECIDNGRHTKLTQEKVDEIRRLYKENQPISYGTLAKQFGCSKATIADIIKNRTWNSKK